MFKLGERQSNLGVKDLILLEAREMVDHQLSRVCAVALMVQNGDSDPVLGVRVVELHEVEVDLLFQQLDEAGGKIK